MNDTIDTCLQCAYWNDRNQKMVEHDGEYVFWIAPCIHPDNFIKGVGHPFKKHFDTCPHFYWHLDKLADRMMEILG